MQVLLLPHNHPVVCASLPLDRLDLTLLLEVLRVRDRQGEGEDVPSGEHPSADAHTACANYRCR